MRADHDGAGLTLRRDVDGQEARASECFRPADVERTAGIGRVVIEHLEQPPVLEGQRAGYQLDQAAAGAEIADLRKLQPRLGVAWDITGDAKNLVKASWGRFMHPSSTALPDYAHVHLATFSRWRSCSTRQGFASPEQCQAYAANFGQTWVAGPDRWDPNGWYQDPTADVFASEPGRIAPGLRPGYGDEVTLGFEREIARKTSIEVSYVGRVTRSLFEDTRKGNLEGLTIDDPGYCPYYVVANLDGLRRDYHGAILKLETRATDWMWLVASYTWSKSMGNLNYSLGANSEFDFCPEQCVNTYGYRYDDRRHRVKLNGYFNLPAHFRLGIDSYWESAFSYSKTQTPPNAGYGQEFLEPRGSRRANNTSQIDLSLTYRLKLGRVAVELIGSVVNVLNTEQPVAVCEDINGCGSYAFGDATWWQNPRRFEAGFRLEF